ncbi:MAG: nucleotidyltransferase domain-containing protein, partial [Herbiconiux sp.]|nr:nucleotidyltransferase domain-containing protein [Herbiconiux sp.]
IGVEAVALGGSRAQGTNRPDSDWDFSIYYRHDFDPVQVRQLGWDGHATELGGWGPLFNGGGAFVVESQPIDIHFRDLDLIDRIHDDAEHGKFTTEPLLFHQAGIPSYILLAELGVNRTLRGALPDWEYPVALREAAPSIWWFGADLTLHYAREGHAKHGRTAQCAGLLSEAACRTAHAIMASRGEWVTNEKQLLSRAGLRSVDASLSHLDGNTGTLLATVDEVRSILEAAAADAGIAVGRPTP